MENRARLFVQASKLLALTTIIAGFLVVVGWFFDISLFKSVFPDAVTMKFNTAICFVLTGLSLLVCTFEKPKQSFVLIGRAGSLVAAGIGLLTFFEYLSGLNLGIDQLLFPEPVGALYTTHLGRMSILTASSFFLINWALLLLLSGDEKVIMRAQVLSFVSGLLAYLSLMGAIFGSKMVIVVNQSFTAMASHTILLLCFLPVGTVLARPKHALTRLINSDSSAGLLLRQVWPLALILPAFLGWLITVGARFGVVTNEFGFSFVAVANLVFFCFILWQKAESIQSNEERLLQVERSLIKLNRARQMVSNINQALIHIDDEATLLEEACRIAVEAGGYRFAWVGFADNDEAKTIRPVAAFGDEAGYLERIRSTWAGTERGVDPLGVTVRTARSTLVGDIATELASGFWRENALKQGYRSLVAVPLTSGGKTLGMMAFYSTEAQTFMEEEIKILEELANDLAFGLTTLRLRTEHRLAEIQVRQERDRANSYLNTVETIIVALDREGKITVINRKGCEILGRRADELIGQSWFSTCLPQPVGKEQVYPVFLKLIAGEIENTEYYENSIVTSRGEIRLIAWHNAILRSEVGEIIGTLSSGDDITERKQEQQELLDAREQNFRKVIDNAGEGILLANIETKKFYLGNPAICRLLGYSQEEIRTLEVKDIHPENDLPYILEHFEQQTQGYYSVGRDFPVKKKDGTVFYADINTSIIKIAGQSYLLGFFHDNTERKKVETELVKLKSAIDSSVEAVFITNLEGVITYVNPGFTALYGFSAEEVIDKVTPRILKSGQLKPEEYESFWKTIINKQTVCGELVNKRKDGSLVTVEGSANAIVDNDGKIIGFLAIQRDITERKKAEENERKIYELMRIDELKTEFISTASHELRTPLTIVKQGIDLVLEGEIKPKQKEFLEAAQRNVNRLARLIDNLLDISKIEAQKMEVRLESIDIGKVAEDVVAIFQPQAEKEGISLTLSKRPETPLIVLADMDKLNEVFHNLISNALKYSGQNTSVSVEITDRDRFAEVAVLDTGRGIAQENLSKLFKKFEQFGRTEGPGAKGTGLGLAITKGLVELQGGEIRAESELGQGTKFYFTIPKA